MSVSTTPIYFGGKRTYLQMINAGTNLSSKLDSTGTIANLELNSNLQSILSLDGITVPSSAIGDTLATLTAVQTFTNTTLANPTITGNFNQTGTGTFSTASGTNSLNGNIVLPTTKTITIGSNTLYDASGNISGTSLNLSGSGQVAFTTATTSQAVSWADSGSLGRAFSSGQFSSTANAGDLILRAGTGQRLLLQGGNGGAAAGLRISSSNAITTANNTLDDGSGNSWVNTLGIGTGAAASTSLLQLPYPSSSTNQIQIGAISDFGTDRFALGIAFPSATLVWPFGIESNNAGTRTKFFTVSNIGVISTKNNTLDDGSGNTTFTGVETINIANTAPLIINNSTSTGSFVNIAFKMSNVLSGSVGFNSTTGMNLYDQVNNKYIIKGLNGTCSTQNNTLDNGSGNMLLATGAQFATSNNSTTNGNDGGTFPIRLFSSTTATKELFMGYDSTNDRGVIQAIQAGVTKKPLILNPNGGSSSTTNNMLDDGTSGNMSIVGTVTSYNGLSLVGLGFCPIIARGSVTAFTTTTNVLTYNVPAGLNTQFTIYVDAFVTAISSGSIQIVVLYTAQTGGGSPQMASTATSGSVSTSPITIRAKAGTSISIATQGTFTATYDLHARIQQMDVAGQ